MRILEKSRVNEIFEDNLHFCPWIRVHTKWFQCSHVIACGKKLFYNEIIFKNVSNIIAAPLVFSMISMKKNTCACSECIKDPCLFFLVVKSWIDPGNIIFQVVDDDTCNISLCAGYGIFRGHTNPASPLGRQTQGVFWKI